MRVDVWSIVDWIVVEKRNSCESPMATMERGITTVAEGLFTIMMC